MRFMLLLKGDPPGDARPGEELVDAMKGRGAPCFSGGHRRHWRCMGEDCEP
jgi:hypothetical protein